MKVLYSIINFSVLFFFFGCLVLIVHSSPCSSKKKKRKKKKETPKLFSEKLFAARPQKKTMVDTLTGQIKEIGSLRPEC